MKEKKKQTHIQVDTEDKERLEELRDAGGYKSIAVVVKKLLNKHNGKEL